MKKMTRNRIGCAGLLGIAVAVATAQGQQIDEEALHERILEICKPYLADLTLHPSANARERVLEGGLSPEWVTEVMENLVRENLPVLEAMGKDAEHLRNGGSRAYNATVDKAVSPILMLGVLPGPKTLDLLSECASFKANSYIRYCAIDSYIAIAGGDSTPFLQEAIAKRLTFNNLIVRHIGGVIPKLKKEGRDGDVAKLLSFLLEQAQTEQDWTAASALDKFLCSAIDGYAQSVQREQAVRRFIDSENESAREGFAEIKAAVDAVPADRRTDLGGRFTREGPNGGADGEDGGTGTPPSSRTWLRLALALLALLAGSAAAWRKAKRK
ncbi:MAG: hypothetical protein FWH21_08565 [Kiritimatiellaeota bacterium]|nr:hypothetical protein [Kiritimatiellota bacterium]